MFYRGEPGASAHGSVSLAPTAGLTKRWQNEYLDQKRSKRWTGHKASGRLKSACPRHGWESEAPAELGFGSAGASRSRYKPFCRSPNSVASQPIKFVFLGDFWGSLRSLPILQSPELRHSVLGNLRLAIGVLT